MNELFNVTTNGDKLTLSARELHKELNVTDRFTRWFERMEEYGFEENVDFTSVKSSTLVNNGATRELQEQQKWRAKVRFISLINSKMHKTIRKGE